MTLHVVDVQEVITYAANGDDQLRGLGVARSRISHFRTTSLPCECVI